MNSITETLTGSLGILFFFAAFGGWVANIVKLGLTVGSDPVTSLFVARCVGIIFPPLGAVLGFL